MKPEVRASTILATKGNEEMQEKMVMPGGVMSTSLSSGLGDTTWRSPRRWEKFPGDCVGRGGMEVKRVVDKRGKPYGRSADLKFIPGSSARRCQDIARCSTEGRWVLVEDLSWQCQASSCGFPGMASGCAEVGEIRLFEKILMDEGATPWFAWEDRGLQRDVC